MNGKPASIMRDILRVDHAGEYGAIRIYGAQIAVARRVAPDILPFLEEALADERRHRATFEAALRARRERPCDLLPLWGIGGSILGMVTAMLGRRAILTCTEAVERTVHRHMNDQIAWLARHDQVLAAAITAIRDEEATHLEHAHAALLGENSVSLRLLDKIVAGAVELLVWISTYGVSSSLGRALRNDPSQ